VTFSLREWIHLAVRWFHVFAGIMWVGQTYYFTWLDGQFGKLEKEAAAAKTPPAVWMVHSGGFYTVEKQSTLGILPELVHWFRWEALMTWVSGMVLLVLVYYFTGGLLDPDVANISQLTGIAIGLAVLAAGWHIYDLAVRSYLGNSEWAFATFSLVMTAAISWGLMHVLSGRAAFIHVGAMFGTIMTANVWFRILHAQRKAHAGGNADGRRSADNHVADYVGDLLVRGAGYIHFFGGQLRLIDEDYAAGGPFEGLDHESVVSRWSFVVRRSSFVVRD